MVTTLRASGAILAALLLLPGCVTDDLHPRFQPAWEKFDPAANDWLRTRKILLVSDCQLHNLYSKPLPDRNLSTKALVGTAIRPPQLDLFSADVMRWILAEGSSRADAIVHLGDALDLGCVGELDTFLEIMRQTSMPWVMAPGNHDFYYFGTYDPESPANWDDACYGAGSALRKHRFIRLYVAALLAQGDPGFGALAGALGLGERRQQPREVLADALPEQFEWEAAAPGGGFLRRIAWSLDAERPWRSFLLQEVDMSGRAAAGLETAGTYAILLDSCQYQRRPILLPNGWRTFPLGLNCGSHGEMLPDQLRTVRAWIERDRAGRSQAEIVFACHHPFDSLAPRTKSSLGWLWREHRIALLITAHTHLGFYAHHDLGGERDELELNVASMVDWPMEWRTLQGFARPSAKQAYIRSERFTLVEELKKREGYFGEGWEVPLDAPDDYRKYKQGLSSSSVFLDLSLVHHFMPHWLPQPSVGAGAAARDTERAVKDTLLWTYLRLLQMFPSQAGDGPPQWPEGLRDDEAVAARIVAVADKKVPLEEKIAFLQQLERFERTRISRDDAGRARFKLSQAAWASRFEKSLGRRLSVDDELIRIDWEKSVRR